MVVDVRCGSGSDGGPGDGGPQCDAMEAAVRRKAQRDAEAARAAAEFEASGAWQASGAVSAKAWLVHHCRLSRAEAGRLLRRGRALRQLPLVDRAFAEGAVTGDHVDLLVGLDHGATRDPLHHQEQLLVDLARTHTFDEWRYLVAYWRMAHDPDGTTEEAEERRNRRDVQLVETLDGMWLGRMTLDPVSGTIVANELERLEQLLFEADWAEATDRLGRSPLLSELARTPNQRRADALVMMARRSGSRAGHARKPAPLFTVHMGWETLHGALSQMEHGMPVPPAQVLSWLEGADIQRVTHHPDGPVTMGHAVRLEEVTLSCVEDAVNNGPDRQECPPTDRVFTGATRRAIEIRDRQCTHPCCDRPARYCQIDHITPWTQGGPTIQANGP